ncbi:multicopper oxidase domain-containing protein [Roseofilum casamattae]|uniref:Multicopper oxidase domain-containing protein n=1 Tax=Roseofilum casamattae BLCC-M143 TaxID=3022442 RepID=A0ABT7BXH9_9CYAN|nr:multicopper oxidase domain-containing protein [Roseofilum casamattae]MDJ1182993.1 multicopper oxidase domain-containing protein [Roseofilum casamattae BLCC-M143]
MVHQPYRNNSQLISRRTLLSLGIAGSSLLTCSTLLKPKISRALQPVRIPSIPQNNLPELENPFDPMAILRDFDFGTLKRENGQTIREFEVTAKSSPLNLNSVISFVSWNLNDRIPGPTLRAKEGERVRIIFHNEGGHSHSLHFHGTHPVAMDGIEPIRHGKTTIYEFNAEPFGVHPYHCHIAPVTRHISKGLYGLFIVDPPQDRVPADEMVMVMGGFDINNDQHNELYAFNGIPNYYRDRPIPIYQHQLIRLYLLNMIEFDPAVTFHIHANMFQVFPTGRTLKYLEESDVITMGTAERHILEFSYKYPGRYMFHPHQDDIAERGCMGFFEVIPT